MTTALANNVFLGLALPGKRSQDFGWRFALASKSQDYCDGFFGNNGAKFGTVIDVSPRTTSDDTVDCAVGESKGLGHRDLLLAFRNAAFNLPYFIFRKLFSPAASVHRITDVLSVRKPFEVAGRVVHRIMINVAGVRKVFRVGNESNRNQSMDQELALISILGKDDTQSAALSAPGKVGARLQNVAIPANAPTPAVRHNTLDASYTAKVANFIQAFVANHCTPFLKKHSYSPFMEPNRVYVMDANKLVNGHHKFLSGDYDTAKNAVKSAPYLGVL